MRLTGRALAPVEAIRRRVASIEGTAELSARVPVPGGNDELSRLAETMNSMLRRLQAGTEAQRRFIGDASHELRSPLATIRAVHEVGALHPEAADWPQLSHEVLEELGRASSSELTSRAGRQSSRCWTTAWAYRPPIVIGSSNDP